MHKFDLEVGGTHNYFVDGVMVHNSPETTPGGRALKFYSSIRLDIRRIESLKDGAEVVGNRTRVKVVKNKCSPPFRQAEFDIMYGKGISREGALLDMAVDMNIVKKSGAWFTYEGEQLGQGRENAKAFLTGNPEIMVDISDKVLTMAGLRPDGAEEAGGAAESSPPTTTPRSSSTDRRLAVLPARVSAAIRSRRTPIGRDCGRQRPGLKTISQSSTTRARWVMPRPAQSIERARSLGVAQRRADEEPADDDEDDPDGQRGDDPAVGHLDGVVRHADHPHAEHPDQHQGGQAEAQVPPGDLAAGPGADHRRVDEQRSEGGDDAEDVQQAEELVAGGDGRRWRARGET